MKFCSACGRITAGEPFFCQFCGRTYDVKLCPRRHANPRVAEVCSHCGSRELSTPHPQVSPVWRLLGVLARVTVGLLIAYVLLVFVKEVLTNPKTMNALMALGLLFLALWVLWGMLPMWFRRVIHWSLGRKKHGEER